MIKFTRSTFNDTFNENFNGYKDYYGAMAMAYNLLNMKPDPVAALLYDVINDLIAAYSNIAQCIGNYTLFHGIECEDEANKYAERCCNIIMDVANVYIPKDLQGMNLKELYRRTLFRENMEHVARRYVDYVADNINDKNFMNENAKFKKIESYASKRTELSLKRQHKSAKDKFMWSFLRFICAYMAEDRMHNVFKIIVPYLADNYGNVSESEVYVLMHECFEDVDYEKYSMKEGFEVR